MPNKTTTLDRAEKQLSVSVRKTRQKTQLLIIQPEFIQDIQLLRRKWNVPVKGLSSIEEFDKWQKWFDGENWKYQNVEYKKFYQGNKVDSNYPKLLQGFNSQIPINILQQDLVELIKKYKLSPMWLQGLRGYLLRNSIPLPAGVIIEHSTDAQTNLPILKLIIQEDTSIKDVVAVWDQVKNYQKKLPYWRQKKSQPIFNLERNKKAYELKESGKSYNEIADELACGYNEVIDFVKSYKSYLKKNQIR